MKTESAPTLHSPPDAAAWDDLVSESPEGTVFHTSAWARLWTREWREARWEAIVIEEGSRYVGAIGLIVRRRGLFESVDSMPFATYGGPIVRRGRDSAAIRRQLLEAYARRASRRFVLRSQLAWYQGTRDELPERLHAEETFTHVLPLASDYERVADGFSPSTRRLVRQSDESGLAIRPAETIEDVKLFHDIAVETVRRRGGSSKPFSLYSNLFEHLVPSGLARFHLVSHGEETVAGSLHLFHQGVAVSWLPVSRESSWHLRPNNFLTASILETLCAAGYLEYNFGASPPDAAGLIRFKEGWGARPRPVLLAGRRSALHRRLRP
jgi:CelD/BcsL family acetyltransferase involved in cellulose biosynthesis